MSAAASASDLEAGCAAARRVLARSATPEGFVASAGDPHYASLWTRDVAFSALGANVSGDDALVDTVRRSLLTLATIQAGNGQIPNDFWPTRDYWDFHEAGCTDATALFIVTAAQHLMAHFDAGLRERLWPHLCRAEEWLASQDANQFTLIDSPMGGDWMDSTFQRSGKLLYVNAIYHRALRGMVDLDPDGDASSRRRALAVRLRANMNALLWPEPGGEYADLVNVGHARRTQSAFPHPVGPAALAAAVRADRKHYISHVEGGRFVDECDVLGNVLAVLYGVAEPARARRVMEHLHGLAATWRFPVPPYSRTFPAADRWGMYKEDLDRFQGERWRNPPGSYHNGGLWPFAGALYVVALARVGMATAARSELQRVTAANRLGRDGQEWGFHEWIHADTGAPHGAAGQTWNAGTYLLAVEAVRGGSVWI